MSTGILIESKPWMLRILLKGHLHKKVTLRPGSYILGRMDDCDILLAFNFVSRHHCVIQIPDHSWDAIVIQDLNSRNGTFVGEERLVPFTPRNLGSNDSVTVCDFRLEFQTQF